MTDSSFRFRIPRNLEFAQMDVETAWPGLGLNSWDLIHMRTLKGSIQSWPPLYSQIFKYVLSSAKPRHVFGLTLSQPPQTVLWSYRASGD